MEKIANGSVGNVPTTRWLTVGNAPILLTSQKGITTKPIATMITSFTAIMLPETLKSSFSPFDATRESPAINSRDHHQCSDNVWLVRPKVFRYEALSLVMARAYSTIDFSMVKE